MDKLAKHLDKKLTKAAKTLAAHPHAGQAVKAFTLGVINGVRFAVVAGFDTNVSTGPCVKIGYLPVGYERAADFTEWHTVVTIEDFRARVWGPVSLLSSHSNDLTAEWLLDEWHGMVAGHIPEKIADDCSSVRPRL